MNDFDNEEQSMRTMRGDTNEGTLGRIDQYDIIRKLGGGGFGVVYLVRDTQSDVEYAIKTLHPLLKSNPEEMENLRSQFKLVSKLNHSHIASAMYLHPVKEVVYANEDVRKELRLSPGDFVMVMKYASGVTLSQWRKQFDNGIVPVDIAIDICKQVASALDYAHSEKIIHRDIKPSNIMVETREGAPIARVLDFGLAAEIRSSMSRVSTEKGNTSGTRPYMAPEQWQGKKQGPATDQYALACMFYELVSGAVPFAGVFETGDFNAMMYAVENRTAEQLLEVSTYQNKVLQRALSKDMTKRFTSCGEFVNKLSKKHSGFRGKFLFVLLLCIVGAFVYTSKTKMPPVETLPQAQGPEVVEIEQNDPLAEQPDTAPVSVDESLHKEESLSQEAPPVVQEEQPNAPEPAANSLVLPGTDATIEELNEFLVLCDSKIEELKAKGYFDTDQEILSINDLKQKADALITQKYKEQEELNRQKRAMQNKEKQEEQIRLNQLKIIKKNVQENYNRLDKTWTDGVFATKRKEIEQKKSELEKYSKASDLEKAQAAQTKILEEIYWINENTASRSKIGEIEQQIADLSAEIQRAEVQVYALSLYNQAEKAIKSAKDSLSKGNWINAEESYKSALSKYKEGISSSKEQKAQEKVEEARRYRDASMWQECLSSATDALNWNPNNKEAIQLQKESNSHLKPTLVIKAKCDGKLISGKDLVQLGGKQYDIGEAFEVIDGTNYGNAEIRCKIGGKNYSGQVSIGKVTWKGTKELVINLEEIKEQPRITVAGIEMVRIPDSATHKGLYFGKYEVTQAQWQSIMGDNPSYFTGDSSRPVENVSWNNCQEFIKKLNSRAEVKQAGITFRLPTEEEWEYACRAGSTGKYGLLANGREGSLDEMGWYRDNSGGKTHPVGQKKPNAWGLYDMHGNV
ncbi:MAG: protein kinase, partial [Kiritimatiellae bacterium]|nr:protein kinase [Kiritimatiellia bacterium]